MKVNGGILRQKGGDVQYDYPNQDEVKKSTINTFLLCTII